MATVCLGGTENDVSFLIYEDEGEYIAQIINHRESMKIETFPKLSPAKKWVNRMLDTCCCEQNEIDRFNF
jgi:hypothetical protein